MESCAVCGKQGESSTIKRCSRCKTVRYCSTRCQSRDWPRHKVTCRESSVDGPMTGAADKPTQTYSTTSPSQPPSTPPSQPPSTPPHPFASLSGGTLYGTPWQEARSRAQEAFPGLAVTDDLTADLDLTKQEVKLGVPFPFSDPIPFPFDLMFPIPARLHATCGTVVVLRLVQELFVPPHLVWVAKDCRGKTTYVLFMMDFAANYFRFSDLQGGNFLCVKRAAITVRVRVWIGFIVLQDPRLVRVFRV